MRRRLLSLALPLLFCAATASEAQVSFGIETPGVSIGINLPAYPTLVRVPDYPVYYDPQVNANYFFYDGLFWVFAGDTWYQSAWYDGPWEAVAPAYVPVFLLRVPVRYYREPPAFFTGWRADAPPRWGEHWGHDWESRHAGWDRWNRHAAPPPAPLPVYQRAYSGDRYPRAPQQQHALRTQHYHYQPHENVSRQAFAQQPKAAPARAEAPSRAAGPTRTAQPRTTTPSAAAPRTAAGNEAHVNERNAKARSSTPNGETRPPTRNARSRPTTPSGEERAPTSTANARPPTQTAHAAPEHPRAAPARPASTPQVAHQTPRTPPQARNAQTAKAPERGAQHAPEPRTPSHEAQMAHAAAAPHAPPRNDAAPQSRQQPREARGGDTNDAKRAEHENKGHPQQQGKAGDKDERHG